MPQPSSDVRGYFSASQEDSRPASPVSGSSGIESVGSHRRSHRMSGPETSTPQRFQATGDERAVPNIEKHSVRTKSEQRTAASKFFHLWKLKYEVVRWWNTEIIATLLAVGILIAIFLVLLLYNGKQTSAWPLPISLSALIATLSTLGRIALGMVASEIISQSKWSWFSTAQPRSGVPLHDMSIFDQASRGPWGSILLVKRSLYSPHLFMTLVVVLASNAMGPFAQQAVFAVECRYISDSATASIPNTQTVGDLGIKPSTQFLPQVSSGFKISLLSSFPQPIENDSTIVPTCTTGNCTLRLLQEADGSQVTHRSVGFCSRCVDVSSLLERVQIDVQTTGPNQTIRADRWLLPNNHSIVMRSDWTDFPNDIPFLNVSTDFQIPQVPRPSLFPRGTDVWFRDAAQALVNLTFLSLDNFGSDPSNHRDAPSNPEDLTVSATACTVFACLRNYLASIENGQLRESLVSTEPLIPFGNRPGSSSHSDSYSYPTEMVSVRTPCFAEGQVYTSESISTASNTVTLPRWHLSDQATTDIPAHDFWEEDSDSNIVKITAPPECIYAMDVKAGGWWTTTTTMMQSALKGNCWTGTGRFGKLCREYVEPIYGPGVIDMDERRTMDYFWLEGFAGLEKRNQDSLSAYMDDVAESLTRKLRINADAVPGKGAPGNEWRLNSEVVVGNAWVTTTCFALDWRWLILSCGLTIMTIGLLTWTIVYGQRSGETVWKSSVLPLIYYRDRLVVVIDNEGEVKPLEARETEPLMNLEQMEAETKKVKVVFRGDSFNGRYGDDVESEVEMSVRI